MKVLVSFVAMINSNTETEILSNEILYSVLKSAHLAKHCSHDDRLSTNAYVQSSAGIVILMAILS